MVPDKFRFSDLVVVIADDSPIVISSLKSMLIKLGIVDRNLYIAKTAKEVVYYSAKIKFDVYISDYNFGKGINGKQLFEELVHINAIENDTVFIMITAENSAFAIRAIIELKPDEYLLKPFNIITLKSRISSAIRRKKILHNLYAYEKQKNYDDGITLCNELLPLYPEYYFLIEKFRASFLSLIELHQNARDVYENILNKKQFNWAKIGLANEMGKSGNLEEATVLIDDMLKITPEDVSVRMGAANIRLLNDDIPRAIAELEIASKLVPGNSERELVIVNLCLSKSEFATALDRYDLYIKINRDTYRDGVYSKLNHIRVLLYACKNNENKGVLINEAKAILAQVRTHYDKDIHDEIELLLAHIALETSNYKLAMSIINKVYNENSLSHFYGVYHLAWLLNELCYESEFCHVIKRLNLLLDRNQSSAIILSSKIVMESELVKLNEKKLSFLRNEHRHIKTSISDAKELLKIYLKIKEKCPYIKSVNVNIIKLLSRCWPERKSAPDVIRLIEFSDRFIRHTLDTDELEIIEYEKIYEQAFSKCKEHINSEQYG
ncbi:response regulator [Vibrio sinensis]|uniref:Response regulator n=1 Tax=Vibrio sinensis TaxID=2302434 RepID=A0A3A6QS80_9VIBR|nr:response regulator [Vibrio sinensis]RJX70911.1 response regulator [Vibrio sinensis]